MSKIADQGLLFNVESERMTTESGRVIPNKRALINAKTGGVMSIVSDAYKVVTNEEIFSSFCHALSYNSAIDCTDVSVDVKQSKNGTRAMVNFAFPAHEINVANDSSPTRLQISALNSFDGSTRYITKAGGLRMKCMNGQILGDIVGSYSSTHTRNLDVGIGADKVIQMFKDFNSAKEYWGQMMQFKISTFEASDVLIKFLKIKNYEESRENARLSYCLKLWEQYRGEMGSNAYALYNVMTDFISHPMREGKNPLKVLAKQDTNLNRILTTVSPFDACTQLASGVINLQREMAA
jgi:hypothetical protein